jgi:hypothetical protein
MAQAYGESVSASAKIMKAYESERKRWRHQRAAGENGVINWLAKANQYQ